MKISNGPRSCTNPFLRQSFPIPEHDNLNVASLNTKNFEQLTATSFLSEQEKPNHNPFSQQQQHENCLDFSNIPYTTQQHDEGRIAADELKCAGNMDTINSQKNSLIDDNNLPTNIVPETTEFVASYAIVQSETQRSNNVSISGGGTFRNRSLSETTEIIENELLQFNYGGDRTTYRDHVNSSSTNPFRSNLHKTLSETYLEQYLLNSKHRYSASQMWMFSKSLSRQSSNVSLTKSLGSQSSILSSENGFNGSDIAPDIKRAMSCDSVSSDSSVILADLEQPVPATTGMLCVGLQYDK